MLLEMLEQRAAGAVDDAFRHAGRARRIENVKRVIERQAPEGDLAGRERREEIGERGAPRQPVDDPGRRSGDRAPRPSSRSCGMRAVRSRATCPASLAPCRRSNSRRRRTAGWARSGRTGRSTPPTPKSGEQDDHTAPRRMSPACAASAFRRVRQIARDPVAVPDARRGQRLGEARDQVVELAPWLSARAGRSSLRSDDGRRSRRAGAAGSRRKLSRASGNQRAPGMAVGFSSTRVAARLGPDAGKVPHRDPELLGLGRPTSATGRGSPRSPRSPRPTARARARGTRLRWRPRCGRATAARAVPEPADPCADDTKVNSASTPLGATGPPAPTLPLKGGGGVLVSPCAWWRATCRTNGNGCRCRRSLPP